MTLTTIKQSLNEKEKRKTFSGWDLSPPSTTRNRGFIMHGVSEYESGLYDVTSS